MEPDPEILAAEPVRLARRRETVAEVAPRAAAPTPRRAVPRGLKAAALAAAVAVSVGLYVDHRIGVHEAAAAAACNQQLRSVTRGYDGRSSAMYAYVRPTVSVPGAGPARLVSSLMAEPATWALPSAEAALQGCRRVRVLPWHSTNVARRDADVAYASALVRRLVVLGRARPPFDLVDPRLARLRAAAGIPPALG